MPSKDVVLVTSEGEFSVGKMKVIPGPSLLSMYFVSNTTASLGNVNVHVKIRPIMARKTIAKTGMTTLIILYLLLDLTLSSLPGRAITN